MCAASYAEEEARKAGQLAGGESFGDGLHNLLQVVADIYCVHPDLWLNPALR